MALIERGKHPAVTTVGGGLLARVKLERGEEVIADYAALCHGAFAVPDIGRLFITNGRIVWIDLKVPPIGTKVLAVLHESIQEVASRAGYLSLRLLGGDSYSFKTGRSAWSVMVSEAVSLLPEIFTNWSAAGDRSAAAADQFRAAIAEAGQR